MKTNFRKSSKLKKMLTVLIIVVLSSTLLAIPAFADTSKASIRLSGQTRYETSKIISEYYNNGKVQNVVLSTGKGFADALSASVLAHEKQAPILLVDTSVNGSKDAYDYITQHLDPNGTVYIIGGIGVINKEFETKLVTLGFNNIIRVAGNNRYETSYQLANSLSSFDTVVVASGESYPDALSISSFAANKGWPILLTPQDEFPQVMEKILLDKKPSKIYVIGGMGVISDNVKSQISGILPQSSVERLAGQDRFDTNTIIAQTFKSDPKTIYVATGYGFADALAGSSLAAKNGDPIIFIDPSTSALPKSVVSYFKVLHSNNLNPNFVAFGGTSVVPESVLTKSSNLILGIVEVEPVDFNGDTINTDPATMPSNADQYPYVLTSVDKAVYEIPFIYYYPPDSRNAKDFYVYRKGIYPQIKLYSEEFFDNILNIDYKTLTEESLIKSIEDYLIFKPNETHIKEYVKYVKDNEIILSGNAKLQVPAIYSDGFSIRARMILTFEIKHSKTKENVLYLDFYDCRKKTYEKDNYNLLVDYFLQSAIGTDRAFMAQTELYRAILDKNNCGIIRETEEEYDNRQ